MRARRLRTVASIPVRGIATVGKGADRDTRILLVDTPLAILWSIRLQREPPCVLAITISGTPSIV
jgi:hypothetical protein